MAKHQNILTAGLGLTLFSVSYTNSIVTVAVSAASVGVQYDSYTAYHFGSIFYPVGLFVGALGAWPLSARLGRKPVILGAIVVLILAGILSTVSGRYQPSSLLLAGYLLGSLAAGVSFVVATVWQIEAADARDRGRRAVGLHVAGAAGSAFASWMELAARHIVTYNARTRLPIGLQFVFLVPAAILVYLSHESWRQLLQLNQPDRARAVLESVNPSLATSFDSLLLTTRQTSPKLLTCCTNRSKSFIYNLRPYRRLLLATLLQILQIWAGIGTASTYMYSSAYEMFSPYQYQDGEILEDALPTIQLVFAFIPLAFIDRPLRLLGGRRNLLIVSLLGMAVCFLPPTIAASTLDESSNSYATYNGYPMTKAMMKVNFAFFLISNVFYALGLGPIPDLYSAEIAPSNCRIAVMAVSYAVACAFSLMYQFLWIFMLDMGFYLFILWMFLDIAIAALVWLVYPETAGKGLESIDVAFARGMRVLVFKDRDAKSVERSRHGEGEQLTEATEFGHAAELSERRGSADLHIESQEAGVRNEERKR